METEMEKQNGNEEMESSVKIGWGIEDETVTKALNSLARIVRNLFQPPISKVEQHS